MFGYVTLLYSIPAYALSIGISASRAADMAAFLNLGTAIGRPVVGVVSDRFGRIEVPGLLTFVNGVLVFALWVPAGSYGVLLFFCVASGMILGVFWHTVSPLAAEIVGLKELPSVLNLAWFAILLPATFSEVIALKLRRPESGRGYLYVQIFAGVSYFAASLFMLELWRIRQRTRKSTR